ncbi:MAG: GAF domain-containing SpoIIE family protein phosphatase, partial [Halanaerobacter sp.]
MNEIETKDIEIPEDEFENWQNVVNILAEIMGVTSASVTRVYPPELEIMLVNEAEEAEIEAGERFELAGLFCEEVIKSDKKLLVPNALKDERWQDKPGLETGLISYLGFPLKWPDGDFFGTICVHDKEEMEHNPRWEELMKQFKELIESNLELIYQNQKLSNSLEKGFKIHQKLLPNELPDLKGILGDSYYQPAIKLGGDFYNFILLNDLLIVYLVDVAGHDLDGAITNIFVREAINSFLLFSHSPGEDLSPKEMLLFLVKRYKEEEFPDDQLVSFLMGVLDLEGMEFTFVNAGIQIAPLIIDKNGGVESLDCKGVPISSAIEDNIYDILEEKSINFSPGKSVFLTTDGLIEEEKGGEIYGEDRLRRVLMNNYSAPPSLINYRVRKDFKEFAAKTRG